MHMFSSYIDSRGDRMLQAKIRVTRNGIVQINSGVSLKSYAISVFHILTTDDFTSHLTSHLNIPSPIRSVIIFHCYWVI
jgi:hypothetical protein